MTAISKMETTLKAHIASGERSVVTHASVQHFYDKSCPDYDPNFRTDDLRAQRGR